MALQVTELAHVGIEVGGVDIARPIDAQLAAQLVALWNEHGIVVFRDQDVTPENQIAFSRLFGELEMHPLKATTSAQYPELFMLVNEPEKEKFMTASYDGEDIVGRLDWHMDMHYTGKPNRGALLRSVVCAEEGGLTGFADLARAWDALDEDTRALLEKIEVTYAF
ncbi:MAG: TauD/TfdA family dioxygenase, partial [Halioglobus sp.]|nr:TauD/TfdA family dioxygenase [Halioglobus sp.]